MAGEDTGSPTSFIYTEDIPNYSSNVDDYPESYDIDDRDRNGLLDLMNHSDLIASGYLAKHNVAETDEDHEKYMELYEHWATKLSAYKQAYQVIGLYVERWGEEEERPWILATRKDAQEYQDKQSQEKEYDYPHIGSYPSPEESWSAPEGDRDTKSGAKRRYFNNPAGYVYPDKPPLATEADLEWNGTYWYSPSSGYMYYPDGQLAHDAVYRYSGSASTPTPKSSSNGLLSYRNL